MPDDQEPMLAKDESSNFKLKHWKWLVLVALQVILLLVGQASGIILARFYYAQGGKSKWLIALSQTAGFPLLLIPLFLLSSSKNPSSSPSAKVLAPVYFVLGMLLAGETIFFSFGLSYLSASTYSLLCATQLVFVAVFSYFINSQKITILILNSVVVLSLSAALVAVNDDSKGPTGVSNSKYIIGFICTLIGSSIASLLFSVTQLSFHRILPRETFSVVLELQIYIQLVAVCAPLTGLFVSGEWRVLYEDMEGFGKGRFGYVMTLFWGALAWQVWSFCSSGLIFFVSSLFACAIGNLALAVAPIACVIVFHDNMNGVKIISMLMAIWGLSSYTYQNYLDDSEARRTDSCITESQNDSFI
ncbi:probable purine permease 11 [Morus notabilis]|nr:probable purine permease 11 [Morus notabilis]